MVVSMDVTDTIDEIVESGGDNEGFTGIASASSHTSNNVNRNITHSSTESTEADTTYEHYYIMKNSVGDDKSKSVSFENQGDLFSKQLKELINLQLDLIEYQQAKITNKDKQIMMLKSEKEQLEARICRMERRIALQKRQVEPDENQISKPKIVTKSSSTATPATPTTGIKSEFQRYECHLPVTVTSRNDKEFKFNTYLKTNLNYLDLPDSKLLPNVEKPADLPVMKAEKSESVSVPSWKVVEKTYIQIKDPPEEDITNDAFSKRHLKPELEEKRRKRWDLQHLRQQQQQQHLTQKDKNKGDKGKAVTAIDDDTFTSLYPNPENVMAIEINNTVPVCVFGYPAPAVDIRELELPWFSVAKREIQLRQAKEKLMKKTSSLKKGYTSTKKKYSKIKAK